MRLSRFFPPKRTPMRLARFLFLKTREEADGFRAFYESLQLNPCLDPIHTSGLRAMEEKKHAVYEAKTDARETGRVFLASGPG